MYVEYDREQVHDLFEPSTTFTPQSGAWGLHGIVRLKDRPGSFVFFVTFGKEVSGHVFDEGVTVDGRLFWQSQPKQRLDHLRIKQFIGHDELEKDIHLFLRTRAGLNYAYLGRLRYLAHDPSRERPVYFEWQIIEGAPPPSVADRIGLRLLPRHVDLFTSASREPGGEPPRFPQLRESAPPSPKPDRIGERKGNYTPRRIDFAARDAEIRDLGLRGERLVVTREKCRLEWSGRPDLAGEVCHVSLEVGDGAGYDVRSYNPHDDSPLYIEVKTTQAGAEEPFYVTDAEVAFSTKEAASYVLYRLYDFDTDAESAEFYRLSGDLRSLVRLEPATYRATVASRSPNHH